MMVQVVVKIDKALKQRLQSKLKKQGITLSAFFRAICHAYANDDLDIQVVQKRPFSLTRYLK